MMGWSLDATMLAACLAARADPEPPRPRDVVLDHAPLECVAGHAEEFRCFDNVACGFECQAAQQPLGGLQVVGLEDDVVGGHAPWTPVRGGRFQ